MPQGRGAAQGGVAAGGIREPQKRGGGCWRAGSAGRARKVAAVNGVGSVRVPVGDRDCHQRFRGMDR